MTTETFTPAEDDAAAAADYLAAREAGRPLETTRVRRVLAPALVPASGPPR